MTPFTPQYLVEAELQQFGLPSTASQPDILNLVQMASILIDETCGRIDGDGNGSLVYTTYTQRILLQTRNRNLVMLPIKPIVPIDAATVLQLSGAITPSQNYTYTGVQINTTPRFSFNGQLSGIISASGRYGYTRQDMSIAYPDLFAFINPLNLVTMFGGPAPWVPIDVSNTDYDERTGEVWIPAGLQLQRYSEIIITYNSGFNPLNMPRPIKFATAAVVKNALAKGGGTTALLSMNVGTAGVNATFYQNLIDPVVDQMLTSFKAVRAY